MLLIVEEPARRS